MGRWLRFPDARLLKVFIQSIGINAANNATAATEFVHLTTIDTSVNGNVYFPPFPTSEFELIEEQSFESNINYVYQRYQRKPSSNSNTETSAHPTND